MTPDEENKAALLRAALGAAVPLYMADMRDWTWEQLEVCAHEAALVVASHGDDILYRGARQGDTASAFNALARGLAVLAFMPGGVTFLGEHYEGKQP